MPVKTFNLGDKPSDMGIVVFGQFGVGKTSILRTMPGKGLVIDIPQVEGGTFVISDLSDRVIGIKVEAWEDIEEVYWAIHNRDESQIPGITDVRWIAVDSLTAMQELAKRKVVNERDRSLADDPHMITMREWGGIGQLVGEFVYRLQKLPNLFKIYLVQERTHGGHDDDPDPARIGAAVIKSALAAIAPSVSFMARLTVRQEDGKEIRTLRVGPPGGDFIVKARTPPGKRLPNLIRDPNIGEILRYVYANGKRPRAARDDNVLSFG